jgi:hypothetical protein
VWRRPFRSFSSRWIVREELREAAGPSLEAPALLAHDHLAAGESAQLRVELGSLAGRLRWLYSRLFASVRLYRAPGLKLAFPCRCQAFCNWFATVRPWQCRGLRSPRPGVCHTEQRYVGLTTSPREGFRSDEALRSQASRSQRDVAGQLADSRMHAKAVVPDCFRRRLPSAQSRATPRGVEMLAAECRQDQPAVCREADGAARSASAGKAWSSRKLGAA